VFLLTTAGTLAARSCPFPSVLKQIRSKSRCSKNIPSDIAAEKVIVPEIATKNGLWSRNAWRERSKLQEPSRENSQRSRNRTQIDAMSSLCRLFWALRQEDAGQTIHATPCKWSALFVSSYTRQARRGT
jgi:hypothetical protein